MQSIFSSTDRSDHEDTAAPLAGLAPPDHPSIPDFTAEDPAPIKAKEFVMGPQQVASMAFVGVLAIGIMSAVAYFAGRKTTGPIEPPRVTERVIERVVPAAKAAAPAIAPVASAPVAQQPVAPPAPVPAPRPVPPPSTEKVAQVTTPVLNKMYLQLGSVDIGIAQVMVEGLRQHGIPSIVGVGVSSKVARVLVGPFSSSEQRSAAQRQIEDLGFKPFPRAFSEKDVQPQPEPAAAMPSPKKP